MTDCATLEKIIGYTYENKTLLETAFTHSTYANQYHTESNERMEFLGDAVLELAVSKRIYAECKTFAEGKSTDVRKALVSDENLKKTVTEKGLIKFLRYFGDKENNVGKKAVPSLFEAIVGSIYLDGGEAPAEAFIWRCIDDNAFSKAVQGGNADYISELKELIEGNGENFAKDKIFRTEQENPFVVVATYHGVTTEGTGSTKKQAERNASKVLLTKLKKNN